MEIRGMTVVGPIANAKFETVCNKCGNTLSIPEIVKYFSEERRLLKFWSCPNCGFQFETDEKAPTDHQPFHSDGEAELFPEGIFPSPRF